MVFTAFVVLFFVLFPVEDKLPDFNEVDFSVKSSNQLYFNNMRAYYYTRNIDTASQFVIMRLSKWEKQPEFQNLHFTIAYNDLMSQAYIYIEKENQMLNDNFFSIKIEHIPSTSDTVLQLNEFNTEGHYSFCGNLLNYLNMDKTRFFLVQNGEKKEIFKSEGKKYAKAVLTDYFKLVGKLR